MREFGTVRVAAGFFPERQVYDCLDQIHADLDADDAPSARFLPQSFGTATTWDVESTRSLSRV